MLGEKVSQVATRTYVIRILGAVIGFAGLAIFIGKLGPDSFGSFILFQGVVTVTSTIGSLGVDMAVEKRISGEQNGPFLISALVVKLVAIVPIGMFSLLLQPTLNSYFSAQISHLFFPALIFYSIGRTMSRSLRGELRILESEMLNTFQTILFISSSYTVLSFSYEINIVIICFIISWIIVDFIMFVRSRSLQGKPSLTAILSLMSFMKHSAVIVSLTGPVYSWADTLMIGLFLPTTSVTAYETAWRITQPIVMLSTSFSTTIFPQVSSMSGDDKTTIIEDMIPQALTISTVIVLPAIVGAVVVGKELLAIFFDPTLVIAYVPLVIILIGRACESVNDVAGPILTGLDYPDLVALGGVAQLLSNLLIGMLLIPQIGLIGGAIGTALSLVIVTAINISYLANFVKIEFPTTSWIYSGIYSVLMGTIVYLVKYIYSIETILSLFILVGAGAIIYFTMLLTNTRISKSIKLAIK